MRCAWVRYSSQLGKAMAVESFGFDEVLRKLGASRAKEPQLDTRVLRELQMIGEEACNKARDTYHGGNPEQGTSHADGGYDDHSGNLRGSIGYKILFNGKEVAQGGFDGRGSPNGEEYAVAALEKVTSSGSLWEIVVLAGMEYARYVEAKGYPVITFVQAFLDEQIKKLTQDIKDGKIL